MTDRELLEITLEALESALYPQKKQVAAIAALRAALSRKALDELAEIDRELGLDYMRPEKEKNT